MYRIFYLYIVTNLHLLFNILYNLITHIIYRIICNAHSCIKWLFKGIEFIPQEKGDVLESALHKYVTYGTKLKCSIWMYYFYV